MLNKVTIYEDHINKKIIAKESLDHWTLYDLEGDSERIITKFQEAVAYQMTKGFEKIVFETNSDPYEDYDVLEVIGIREPTKEELVKHENDKKEREEKNKLYRLAEYERLKKEFEC